MIAMAFSDYIVLEVLRNNTGENLKQSDIQSQLDVFVSLRTIQRCISRLEKDGHITVERTQGSNSGSIYHVNQ